jgi:hypothetical protein
MSSIHQRTFLLHVVAQHFAQRFVHEVGDRVVAHGGGALGGVHLRGHGIAHRQRALLHFAVVAKHIGLDFLRVAHGKPGRRRGQPAFVAHLPAAFGVERGGV